MKKGLLIAFEGIDGGGKGTLTDLTVEAMLARNLPTARWAYPRRGLPSAQPAVDYLGGKFGPKEANSSYIASAMFAHDRLVSKPELEAVLASGTNVISERYVDSNGAFQGALIPDPIARAAYLEWLYDLEYVRLGLPKPDLVILVDVPAEVADANVTRRGKEKDILEGDVPYQSRVAQVYRELAARYGHVVIDCMGTDGKQLPPEQCHQKVWAEVSKLF